MSGLPRLHPVQLMGLLEVLRLLLQLLLWEQLLLHLSLLRLLQLTHRRLDLHLVRGGGPCLCVSRGLCLGMYRALAAACCSISGSMQVRHVL